MVSMGWLVDEFVVRWIVSMNWKIVTTMVNFSQFNWLRWSTFSGHPSGRWKHPHRTSHICHLLAPPVFSQQLQFVSQDFGTCILSLSSQVPALCLAHRNSWILLVRCHRLAYCDGSLRRRKVVVCPYHIPTLRTSSTPWFCGYRRHTPLPPPRKIIPGRTDIQANSGRSKRTLS